MPEGFKPTPEPIAAREQLIPNYASFIRGEPVLPPSNPGMRITPEQFKEQYPVRYKIWELIRDSMTGDGQDFSLNNPANVENLRLKLHLLNRFDNYAQEHHSNGNGRVLRERQMTVFEDVAVSLERGEEEGLIEAPTGFGKTVMFNQIVAAADVPTLIVVPSQQLVEQTYKEFQERTPHIVVGRVYAHSKEYGRKVTITTYESLVKDTEGKLIHPEGIGLVILDEQHEGTSEKRIERFEAVEHFENAFILGVSATTLQLDDPRFIDTRVGKMSRNMIHKINDQESVEEGYTAPFTSIIVDVDTDLSDVTITNRGDYNEKELEKKLNTTQQNKAAVDFFFELRERDRQLRVRQGKQPLPLTTSAYATSVAHAQELAREYETAGVKAAAVWGDQDPKERERILEQWEAGEIEVVCSKNLLIRGVNVPPIRLILNVAPTVSPIVEKQRTGRGTRIDPNNPDKHLVIADFVYKNSDKRHFQVTYPQVIGAAQLVKRKVESGDDTQRPGVKLPDFDDMQIEGLKVTSNPEEVMTIVRRIIAEKYQPAPDGWMLLGVGNKNTISGEIKRSSGWIIPRIEQIKDRIQQEWDEQKVPADKRELLEGEFIGGMGKPTIFYSPRIIRELQALALKELPAPVGWRIMGKKDNKATLAGELGRGSFWIIPRIEQIKEEIQREWEEQGIPLEEREPLEGEYISDNGKLATFFAPFILERLRGLAVKELRPPLGWMVVGQKALRGTMSEQLDKNDNWINVRIPQVINEIEKEWEAKEIPFEQRELLEGEYLDRTGQPRMYYSPLVIDRLRILAEADAPAPEGWMVIGDDKDNKATIAGQVKRGSYWINPRIQQIKEEIQKEWDKQGIPVEEQPLIEGKYMDKTGKLRMFYAPLVIDRLQTLAQADVTAPEGWMIVGDKNSKTGLTAELNKGKDWINSRIEQIKDRIQKEWDEQGVPVDKRELLEGKYRSGAIGKPGLFYSPRIIEELRKIVEVEKK